MRAVTDSRWFEVACNAVESRLRKHGVVFTIGGEPSYVPFQPDSLEWNVTALGPTKLRYAYALAEKLIADSLHNAVPILSPGKCYPGELNPRWVIHLLWNRDGSVLTCTSPPDGVPKLPRLRSAILKKLGIRAHWIRAHDSINPGNSIWVLPLDHENGQWLTERWPFKATHPLTLVASEGPAGLRLPLNSLPETARKRALVLELRDNRVHVFFPPLLQTGFLKLFEIVSRAFASTESGTPLYEGYIPHDEANQWNKISITPDPGVLELNLPACDGAREYSSWLEILERCTNSVGLRSFKQPSVEETLGTGGGNHLLFGGPSLDSNPFFARPRWITAILRYWQNHPALSYMFTGSYAGPSSQAPRPDESARDLCELEMAYTVLEQLPEGGDYRSLIGETLRHLHIDLCGNTHRSEVSFDKFWDTSWAGGCRGLIEFRALESLPHAHWMSAIALLWTSLATMLLSPRPASPLVRHGSRLHDWFTLPHPLWADFEDILRDLGGAKFRLNRQVFRDIWHYRFPEMLRWTARESFLSIRRAIEPWPLLCETPIEGGNTSRFIDTSIERLELTANTAFHSHFRIELNGRELPLERFPGALFGAGFRYRRSALYPSLHPGFPVQAPLILTISTRRSRRRQAVFRLDADRRTFLEAPTDCAPPSGKPCRKPAPSLVTYDLRLT